ncbi:DMT family transporter [Anaeromyxobacter oryzisoli]|uniref:DMT family transporter n=1 Tax=Anaeromyxobacter oryzisoli TaxID=2925408 RepID=UPI001F5626A4|nr:DMT family transporter [Anaeromyxobacter sp. SG63]
MTAEPRWLRGAALLVIAAILWGGWALVLRPAGLPPPASALVVQLVLAAPAPFAFRRRAAFRDRGAVAAVLLLGLADAGNIALYFAALDRGPIAVAVLAHYLAPVAIALLAPALGEPRSRRAVLAAPLSLAGLALVLGAPARAPAATAALGAASAVFYVIIMFAARRAARAFPPDVVTSLHAVIAVAALLAVFGRAAIPPPGPGVLRVLAGSLVCGIGASLLFYWGLASVSAPVASALAYVEPVTAAAVGYFAFGEALGPLALAGAALVVGCGAWVVLEPPAGEHVESAGS